MYLRQGTLLAVLPALLAGTACASAGGPGIDRDPKLITSEELRGQDSYTALEAIERLRPLWLRTTVERSGRLSTTVLVYQDGVHLGGVEALRDIAISTVREIRYLDSAEAGRLPGLGSRHVEGAIVLVTH